MQQTARSIIEPWPEESREAAQQVVNAYGEPQEMTESLLIWHEPGPWKRIVASKAFHRHDFPAPHIDAVESVVDYKVPVELVGPIVEFDGSVKIERTVGEVSARCHDEQANFLALNLVNDLVKGLRDPQGARDYYAQEFLNARRGEPTPYMKGLRFVPGGAGATADPDERALSDDDLEQAKAEGSAAA